MKRDPHTGAPQFYALARTWLHVYRPTAQHRSPNTIEAYRISLECFLGYLTTEHEIDRIHVTFDHFDHAHLLGWLTWMSEHQHYTPATIALRLSTIKAFLTYCGAEDITLLTLGQRAATLKAPTAPRKPVEYLTEPQTRALLAAYTGTTAKSRRNRMLLILLYDTAARVGEITTLTLGNLHLAAPGHLTLTGKGNKTRIVPLTTATIDHLRVYLDEFHPDPSITTRPLFYSLRNGKPAHLSTDSVAAVLKSAAITARSACPSIPDRIHCHMLRKTKAMDLYQQGIPLPIIMRLLGHENMSTTTAFYAFATVDMMRRAIDAATPAIDTPTPDNLTDEKLRALYSLR